MGYCKKTYKAGDTIIVEKGYTGRHRPPGCSRAKRINPTPETMKKQNEWNAVKKLTLLMNENFKPGDYHLVLTYRRECRPDSEQAHDRLTKFIRKLRRTYAKAESELMYIHTTEYKSKAIHHHMVANKFDLAEIQKVWPWGMVRVTPLYSKNLQKLAEYFVKETKESFRDGDSPYKQRYVPSRNLKRPSPRVEEISAQSWAQEPKERKGYYIDRDSMVNGVSEVTGYPYQYYIMVSLDEPQKKTEKNLKFYRNARFRS